MATTAGHAEAYNGNLVGALSGACRPLVARKSHRTATRTHGRGRAVRYKARAIELLATHNATEAARALNEEFPEHTITPNAVQRWAKALKIHLPRGRTAGVEQPKYSPNRAPILACHAEGLTQAQTCVRLGLSRALVSKHWPKPPAA